ncbi:MAG: amino acid ABC transporter substrate-binding protein [Gemmatimonadetes bacterium]|nr:amino acid ABC transporter substrate-binding protein [Gemmatimonadota bacterium]
MNRPRALGAGFALLALGSCNWMNPCPTVAYAAGSTHSVTVAVAESVLATPHLAGPLVACYRLTPQPTYEMIDQPDAEVALAERLVADPAIVAVVGHTRSRGSLAAAPVYARAGMPQIVPGATSGELRGVGPWTFVLSPTDSAEAAFLAAAADSRKARRVTLFYSAEPYGEGLAAAIRPDLARRHIQLLDEVRLGAGADIPTLVYASLRVHPSEAFILLVDYSQAAAIARTVVPIAPRTRMIAADGSDYPAGLRHIAGAAAESLWIVTLWRPDTADAATQRFFTRFRQVAGRDPTSQEALGFNALLYARAAITAVGPDRRAIRAWLAGPGGATLPTGHVTTITLHDGPPATFGMERIGPAPVTSP